MKLRGVGVANNLRRILALTVTALALSACKDESASLILDGPNHALTLDIHLPWPWSKEWEMEAIMARVPDCQRRSRLDNMPIEQIRVDIYRPPEGIYEEPILIVRQGASSFALSDKSCEMQRFKTAPKEFGVLLGTFSAEGGGLKFTSAPLSPPSPPAAPAAPGAIPAPASVPGQARTNPAS